MRTDIVQEKVHNDNRNKLVIGFVEGVRSADVIAGIVKGDKSTMNEVCAT